MKLPNWRYPIKRLGFLYGNGHEADFAYMDILGWGHGLKHDTGSGSGHNFLCYHTLDGGGHGNGYYPVKVILIYPNPCL